MPVAPLPAQVIAKLSPAFPHAPEPTIHRFEPIRIAERTAELGELAVPQADGDELIVTDHVRVDVVSVLEPPLEALSELPAFLAVLFSRMPRAPAAHRRGRGEGSGAAPIGPSA
jgi:hypothetical protein